jgi:hypothetical protein
MPNALFGQVRRGDASRERPGTTQVWLAGAMLALPGNYWIESTLQAFCKRQASAAMPRGSVSKQRLDPRSGIEAAFRRNGAACVDAVEAAHNPEVTGSNPAPATYKGLGNRAFLFASRWRCGITQ